jgi:hypothetical protein
VCQGSRPCNVLSLHRDLVNRTHLEDRARSESRLEGGRLILKIIIFEHTLHPGLGLEINNNEFGVQKIILLAMSCSINVDNFGS